MKNKDIYKKSVRYLIDNRFYDSRTAIRVCDKSIKCDCDLKNRKTSIIFFLKDKHRLFFSINLLGSVIIKARKRTFSFPSLFQIKKKKEKIYLLFLFWGMIF